MTCQSIALFDSREVEPTRLSLRCPRGEYKAGQYGIQAVNHLGLGALQSYKTPKNWKWVGGSRSHSDKKNWKIVQKQSFASVQFAPC